MLVLSEKKIAKKNRYLVQVQNSDGKLTAERLVYYRLVITEDQTFVLFDDSMQVVLPAFRYLNQTLADQSFNSRSVAARALRQLYCFCDIFHADLFNLTIDNVKQFQSFLLGHSSGRGSYQLNTPPCRSSDTVNYYIQACRSYLKFLGVTSGYLFETKRVLVDTQGFGTKKLEAGYRSTLQTKAKVPIAPKYISVEQFSLILAAVRAKGTIVDECIIRLMYECGLRRGEVLGLTQEDLTEEQIGDEFYPVVYIRNRFSDNPVCQNAKSCLNVHGINAYQSKDYQTENLGYQKVTISRQLYSLLNQYIELVYSDIKLRYPKNFAKSVADSVTAERLLLLEKAKNNPKALANLKNHYLFLNERGGILTGQTFNKRLRSYFREAGIPVDTGTRQTNLAHRFRHGYAMFLIQHLNKNLAEVKLLMRHRSLQSTMIYFNPTDQEIAETKTDYQRSLYEALPILEFTPWG